MRYLYRGKEACKQDVFSGGILAYRSKRPVNIYPGGKVEAASTASIINFYHKSLFKSDIWYFWFIQPFFQTFNHKVMIHFVRQIRGEKDCHNFS